VTRVTVKPHSLHGHENGNTQELLLLLLLLRC
jgi:hypothetical protein